MRHAEKGLRCPARWSFIPIILIFRFMTTLARERGNPVFKGRSGPPLSKGVWMSLARTSFIILLHKRLSDEVSRTIMYLPGVSRYLRAWKLPRSLLTPISGVGIFFGKAFRFPESSSGLRP